MCGIVGFFDPLLSKETGLSLVNQMLQTTVHRGPDATESIFHEGYCLGHNRLSIIDLSENANQPFEKNNYTLVFNGEIYNYIEIREKLIELGHQFTTKSDTEVIISAYEQWGENCVDHFVGMWAFALLDKRTNFLFCSRDRFGIKPFYYISSGNAFYFASEYKALKVCPIFTNEINEKQVARGLQLGWIEHRGETYYSRINSLRGAHNLFFEDGLVRQNKYWTIDFAQKSTLTQKEKRDHFYDLFMESIKIHMRSDVKLGISLSGGIDSSSIACAVAKMFPDDRETFTIFYEGDNAVDERPWSREVVEKYPNLKANEYSPSDKEIGEHYDKIADHLEVPMPSSSPISQYFLMKMASDAGMKVILDGQGSDEYITGYMHAFYRLFASNLRAFELVKGYKNFNYHIKQQEFGPVKAMNILAKSLLTSVTTEQFTYNFEFQRYHPYTMKNSFRGKDVIDIQKQPTDKLSQFLYHLTFNSSLPNLLHYEDRNSMAFSIESRVPFLDHRLVEFVFSCNNDDKINKGVTKSILRESMENTIPDTIKNRFDKKGFITPGEIKWLKGPLKHLMDVDFSQVSFINNKKVDQLMEDYKKGDMKHSTTIWRLCMLNDWMKKI